jgi:hypothetical protein
MTVGVYKMLMLSAVNLDSPGLHQLHVVLDMDMEEAKSGWTMWRAVVLNGHYLNAGLVDGEDITVVTAKMLVLSVVSALWLM